MLNCLLQQKQNDNNNNLFYSLFLNFHVSITTILVPGYCVYWGERHVLGQMYVINSECVTKLSESLLLFFIFVLFVLHDFGISIHLPCGQVCCTLVSLYILWPTCEYYNILIYGLISHLNITLSLSKYIPYAT